jgi:hypothetical protein
VAENTKIRIVQNFSTACTKAIEIIDEVFCSSKYIDKLISEKEFLNLCEKAEEEARLKFKYLTKDLQYTSEYEEAVNNVKQVWQ